ncbi:hypothetical protein ACQPXH_11195 [Nocardia sp. CA-135953]|uniref:hypothetical protein n=1 Tax=Nocardia sp. CA-135953 TaxID=3239978 RepID=UPI003D97E941
MFGLGWRDIVSGVASGVGFAFGGPVGAALLGGVTGGIMAATEGKSFDECMESALIDGALGAIPGGLVGGAAKGAFLKGGAKALGESFKDAGTLFLKKGASQQFGGFGSRLAFLRAPMNKMGLGTMTATAATAYGNKSWDQYNKSTPDALAELPTTLIS